MASVVTGGGGTDGWRELPDGRTAIKVHLLDNSSKTILVDSTTTIQQCKEMVDGKIGYRSQNFAANFTGVYASKDGSVVDGGALKPRSKVLDCQAHNEKIVYQLRLFSTKMIRSTDPKLIHMQYIQAVHYIIVGIYIIDQETAIKLAALLLLAKFGQHDGTKHKPGFLVDMLLDFIPMYLLSKRRPADWEAAMYLEHAQLSKGDAFSHDGVLDVLLVKAKYVEIVSKFGNYGCEMYPAKQEIIANIPADIIIGINHGGILLLNLESHECIMKWSLDTIYRWGFRPNTKILYWELIDESTQGPGQLVETSCADGAVVAALLTDYALLMLRELDGDLEEIEVDVLDEVEDTRTQRLSVASAVSIAEEAESEGSKVEAKASGQVEDGSSSIGAGETAEDS